VVCKNEGCPQNGTDTGNNLFASDAVRFVLRHGLVNEQYYLIGHEALPKWRFNIFRLRTTIAQVLWS